MSNNIITAAFANSDITYTKPAYQYDYGMILKFSGIELPQAYEVHFSNTEFCGESISQIGDESGVTIPDEMFLSGSPIYAWTYLHTGEDDGETVYKTVISINKRAQPSNIEPTPVQQDVITQAVAALNTAIEQTAADVVASGESAQAAAGSAEAAEQAKDDAVEAKDKAVEAKNAAKTAQGKAEDAQEAAEAAQSLAENARDASRITVRIPRRGRLASVAVLLFLLLTRPMTIIQNTGQKYQDSKQTRLAGRFLTLMTIRAN